VASPKKTIIVDDEIALKSISLNSAQTIFNSIHSSRASLRRWLPFVDQTRSDSDTRDFIKSVINSKNNKQDHIYEIWHKDQFSGLIALKEIDYANLKVEIGYWLDQIKTGNGIMIRSCIALINHAFNELNLNRVMIKVAIGNEKSTAIPMKLNFYQEGVERQGELINDQFNDLVVFSMLKKDWTN